MKSRLKRNFWASNSSQAPAKKFIISVFLACYMITVAPMIYFLIKNYLVLDEIGFKFFPTLLDINNQDKVLIIIFCGISFFAGLAIQLYAHNIFLKRIYEPIDQLQFHMSGLIQGQFDQPKIALKHDQYVHELIKTYNYLYGSLQTNLKRDITFLKELEEVNEPRLAKLLVNEKVQQLNLEFEQVKPKVKSKSYRSAS